jgi:hypothetical protein
MYRVARLAVADLSSFLQEALLHAVSLTIRT